MATIIKRARPDYDGLAAVLTSRPLRAFDVKARAVVTRAHIDARIIVAVTVGIIPRCYTLTPLAAALLALQLEGGHTPLGRLMAGALRRAVADAEARVAHVHALQRTALDRAAGLAAPGHIGTVH